MAATNEIERRFLGWERPGLVSAAEWLIERHRQGGSLALDGAIVVVPGGRAGRRLLEILADAAERLGVELRPPVITTVGQLPELLYRRKRPFADDLLQQLAWARALERTDRGVLERIAAQLPEPGDTLRWLELARVLESQHRELASDVLLFGDVLDKAAPLEGFQERPRWQALATVQDRYLALLDDLGYWDRQTARRVAIRDRECETDRDIYLVGTVDLNQAMRQMLDQVAERVTALVVAPESERAAFDQHGCLQAEAWLARALPVADEQLIWADGPADEARAVVRVLAGYDGRYGPDDVTIGMPDESLLPYVEHQLSEAGVSGRWGAGRRLSGTGPLRLLTAVAAWLDGQRYRAVAELVRHADVYRWLDERLADAGDWLTRLDEFYNRHLPARLSSPPPAAAPPVVRRLVALLDQLLSPLAGSARPAGQWCPAVRGLLTGVYGERQLDREEANELATLTACQAIVAAVDEFQQLPAEVSPELRASELLRLLAGRLEGERWSEPPEPQAVEMVGWLELPLDDAPALVVTRFNEGLIPKSVNSDLFLPDALRRQLELEDNARRYARDAYALEVLLASRADMRLIVARRDQQGDPLRPSRLLLACEPERMARRLLEFYESGSERRVRRVAGAMPAASRFRVPRPERLSEPITSLSVTQFRLYLACKYRFYLTHVRRLQPLDDEATELDGAGFGQLLHEVLRRFGTSDCRHSTDPDDIRQLLDHELDGSSRALFGDGWLPAVGIQLEQLRQRLHGFAERQAWWARQGWRIEWVEAPERDASPAELVVDGVPLMLRGRIDRIDVHESSGEYAILDYKSSDTGKSPEATHRRHGQWVDLQLPLYRHLARTLGVDGNCRLGYVLLPRDASAADFLLADWTDAELDEAERVACEVVRGIRREEFWPRTIPPPDYSEALAAICQDGVLGADVT